MVRACALEALGLVRAQAVSSHDADAMSCPKQYLPASICVPRMNGWMMWWWGDRMGRLVEALNGGIRKVDKHTALQSSMRVRSLLTGLDG